MVSYLKEYKMTEALIQMVGPPSIFLNMLSYKNTFVSKYILFKTQENIKKTNSNINFNKLTNFFTV